MKKYLENRLVKIGLALLVCSAQVRCFSSSRSQSWGWLRTRIPIQLHQPA